MKQQKKLRIFTWHIHGNYLYYLTQSNCEFYLPVKKGNPEGYGGKSNSFPWGNNVHEIPAEKVYTQEFDCILFQSKKQYLKDQYELFSKKQLSLAKIYLEHAPPREHPTDTKHVVNDPNILLVHVTDFNNLMWDNGSTPTIVIEHGVSSSALYTGKLQKGIVVINNLSSRGRRLGVDVFMQVKKHIPLDLVGINSQQLGGIGEIPPTRLTSFIKDYRFFFSPIRYTSLGLSVCEAMMTGLPIISFATTEMVTTVQNGISGYTHTNLDALIENMQLLLTDKQYAHKLGEHAKQYAQKRFSLQRFTNDWEYVFSAVVRNRPFVFDKNENTSITTSFGTIL